MDYELCGDLRIVLKSEKFKRNEKKVFKDAGSLETLFLWMNCFHNYRNE